MAENTMPEIYTGIDQNTNNPSIFIVDAPYAISMYQTAEILMNDSELFYNFVDNAITQFRHSRVYKEYKSYLYDLGLDRCQLLPNINSDMANLEMHHNGITIFDIGVLITHHYLSTKGKVSTFNVIKELRKCHTANKVPLVMLCKTAHQLYHADDEFFIPAGMCFGYWIELLEDYRYGITFGLAKKLYYFIQRSMEDSKDENLNSKLLSIQKYIEDWSKYNEYCFNTNNHNRISTGINYNRVV